VIEQSEQLAPITLVYEDVVTTIASEGYMIDTHGKFHT
jgi:hypothetical protein